MDARLLVERYSGPKSGACPSVLRFYSEDGQFEFLDLGDEKAEGEGWAALADACEGGGRARRVWVPANMTVSVAVAEGAVLLGVLRFSAREGAALQIRLRAEGCVGAFREAARLAAEGGAEAP